MTGKNSGSRQRRRILSLGFFPTFAPPRSGGEQRSFHLLSALSEVYDVISIAPTYAGMREETVRHGEHLTEHRFPKTPTYKQWHSAFSNEQLPVGGADLAMALAVRHHPAFLAATRRAFAAADVVILQHPVLLPAIRDLDRRGKRIVYLSHNCEYELAAQSLSNEKGGAYLSLLLQLEAGLCRMADDVAVVSDGDAAMMEALYGIGEERFLSLPNGSACRFEPGRSLDATEPDLALFLGSAWGPNIEAARIIVEEIAPRCPAMRFAIVGSVCSGLEGLAQPPNVSLEHIVSDEALADLLARAHVGLNPMRSGGGSNVKLADYLAHGLRILTSRTGVRGFPDTLANVEIREGSDLCRRLTELAAGPPPGAAERDQWRKNASARHDWRQIAGTLVDRLEAPSPPAVPVQRHLVLNEFAVRSSDSGGEARIAGLFSALPAGEKALVLAFGRGSGLRLTALSDRLSCLEVPIAASQRASADAANRGAYASVNDIVFPESVAENPVFLDVAATLAARADAVVFSHPFMWPVWEHLPFERPILHDSHNHESALKARALEPHRDGARLLREVERQERAVAEAALLVAACSPADAQALARLGARRTTVAPNGVALGDPPAVASADPTDIRDRTIYLVEEFDAVHERDFVETAVYAVLKQAPCEADLAFPSTGPDWRAAFLDRLVHDPRNTRRILVLGAAARLGRPERTAVFMGSAHRPNLTAAEIAARHLAPAVPDIRILIVGNVCGSLGSETLPANVFLAGFLSDARKAAVLSRCDVGLNPMVGGGGSNLKVPDYLARGLPVLSTDFGARGFRLGTSEGLFRADLALLGPRLVEILDGYDATPFDAAAAREALRTHYDWQAISRRFLDEARTAIDAEPEAATLVVVEDARALLLGPLGPVPTLLADLAKRGPIDLVLQGDPLSPAAARALKSPLPVSVRNVSYAARERDLFISNAGRIVHDNVAGHLLDLLVADADEIAAAFRDLAVAAPVILSGAGSPAAGPHAWRFVSREMILALPPGTRALRLGGKAHEPVELRAESLDGRPLWQGSANGAFDLAIPTGERLLRVVTRIARPDRDTGSLLRLQLNRIAADLGDAEREGDLWASAAAILHALGVASERRPLSYGRPVAALCGEAVDLVAHRLKDIGGVVAIGGTAFADALASTVAGLRPDVCVRLFDGTAIADGVGAHIAEDELGLVFNPREAEALARPHMPEHAILLLAERLNGETLRFAHALKEALAGSGDGRPVALLSPDPMPASPRTAAVEAAMASITLLGPLGARRMVACLAAASFVIVRGDAACLGRVPALVAATQKPAAVWRTGETVAADPFAALPTVATVADVLALLWREVRSREDIAVDVFAQTPVASIPARFAGSRTPRALLAATDTPVPTAKEQHPCPTEPPAFRSPS